MDAFTIWSRAAIRLVDLKLGERLLWKEKNRDNQNNVKHMPHLILDPLFLANPAFVMPVRTGISPPSQGNPE